MSSKGLRWKAIVAGTDLSARARAAEATAVAVAARGGVVTLVHVVPHPPPGIRLRFKAAGGPDPESVWIKDAMADLDRRVGRIRRPGIRVEALVGIGEPWKEIIDLTEQRRADVIVLGRSGSSRIERLLLGSTAERVVRRSPVPILVVGQRPLGEIRRVLLPFDMSQGSRLALELVAARFPKEVTLDALHVVPRSIAPWVDMPDLEEEARGFLASTGTGRARLLIDVDQAPAEGALRRAEKGRYGLIVLATHGRAGVSRMFMGSVAEKIVRFARQPVLVVPGPGRGRRRAVRR